MNVRDRREGERPVERVPGTESDRLVLPDGVGPESLVEEWSVTDVPQESRVLTFWDTFEWGLWFGGLLLYSCGGVYHLCRREGGWPGMEVCRETAAESRRFWGDFETTAMRERLEGMLGLRRLAPVAEGTFRQHQVELRNETGKTVCRLEWLSVATGTRGGAELFRSCRVIPIPGCEPVAERVVARLTLAGAAQSGDGPLDLLLQEAGEGPREYTLRPAFGLTRETPAREAVGRIVRSMLAIATANVPGIIADLDTEFLHDYRICLRKIRSLLGLVKDVYPAGEVARIRRILGKLARQTNRLRDLDVYLLARDDYRALLPPALRPSLEGMFEDFAAEREGEVRRVIAKLRGSSRRSLSREIKGYFLEDAPHGSSPSAALPIGPLAFRGILKRYRKICGIAREIGPDTPDEAIHRLRIEGKKLRYLMEFFAELIPPDEGAPLVKLLKRLQGRLGDFNDASVQQQSLLSYGGRKQTGRGVVLGLGGLVAVLYQRQQQARGLIHESLDEFCSDETAAAYRRIFREPAGDVVPAGPGSASR